MPDHWHFLLCFTQGKDCLSVIRDFKRFTSLKISTYLKNKDTGILDRFRSSAKSKVKHSIWKEQAWVLPLDDLEKIKGKLNYIHNNPVRKRLVSHPN